MAKATKRPLKPARSRKAAGDARLSGAEDAEDATPAADATDAGFSIVTYAEPTTANALLSSGEARSIVQRLQGLIPKIEPLSPETLQTNLTRFLSAMETALSNVPVQVAGYRLDEIEVAVEVSAEGQVSLLGNGGKVGGKGTLTLKLKHYPDGKA
jgi:hypothetical protein